MRCSSRCLAVAALIVAAACGPTEHAAPSAPDVSFAKGGPPTASPFAPTALPTLGGGSGAYAVNDNGVVVGYSAASGVTFPVKWQRVGGTWQVTKLQTASGSATDINESGAAVGASNGFATFWPPAGGAETIGPGSARAVNDAGVVVGYRPGAPNAGAVAWTRSGGAWTEHPLPRQAGVTDGFNEVDDVNNDGVVVGYAQDATGIQHAVKWVPSATTPGEWDRAVPIAALAGSTNSAALGIDGPDVVGIIWRCSTPTVCTSREGYHWSLIGAGIGSFGPADVVPQGLNATRSIVGWVGLGTGRQWAQHPFVWSPGNPTIQDLGLPNGHASGWANDINNPTALRTTRQAVGESPSSAKGGSAAVVWTVP